MDASEHVVIVGNGITGITCALELRQRSECKITVLSEESDRFFSRPALMYVALGHMTQKQIEPYEESFWVENRIQLEKKRAVSIDTGRHTILCSDATVIGYSKLVLATGARYNRFGWPGENLPGVQGFYSLQDLELLEENTRHIRRAVIVGGGLIGVEVAEILHERGIQVDFLVREKYFWNTVLATPEAELVGRHITKQGIRLRYETELAEISADPGGRVGRVTLKNGETLDCGMVALTAGVSPNTDLARASGLECRRGIIINRRFETSKKDVFAAGDVAEFAEPLTGRKAVEQVWYTGKAQAETLARILCGDDAQYAPGVWFNSAKFFDIEYQVYGDVPNNIPADHGSYYWAAGEKCLRLNWQRTSGALTGIHALGIRLRQNVCIRWIEEKKPIKNVMENIRAAFFDPEFYKDYSREIAGAFAAQQKGALAHV